MSRDTDYYSILHVRSDAPPEIIRASYRALMQALRLHPDLGGNTEQAALINRAYHVLSDPARRAEYDRSVADEAPAGAAPAGAAPSEVSAPEQRCLFCGHRFPARIAETDDAHCGRCGSPLARATRHRLERSTRRMLRRTERRLPLRARTRFGAPVIDGMMLNLSLNGMLFESAHEFETNQLIRLDAEICRSLARVTHCREAGGGVYSTGVEFVTIQFASSVGTFVSERA